MSGPRNGESELERLLQEALAEEDRRLEALEERVGALQAARLERAAEEAAAEQEPPAGSGDPLEEARRLVEESSRYLRQLEAKLERLDEGPGLPPAPSTAELRRADAEAEARTSLPRTGSGSRPRPDPRRHELERAFSGGGEPPTWARELEARQERLEDGLTRLESRLLDLTRLQEQRQRREDDRTREEHSEAARRAEEEARARAARLQRLEAEVQRAAGPAPAERLLDLLRSRSSAPGEARRALAEVSRPGADLAALGEECRRLEALLEQALAGQRRLRAELERRRGG